MDVFMRVRGVNVFVLICLAIATNFFLVSLGSIALTTVPGAWVWLDGKPNSEYQTILEISHGVKVSAVFKIAMWKAS
jgi:hypothetical protein